MKYPREIQGRRSACSSVPEASLQQNPREKAKQGERGAGSSLAVGRCDSGRRRQWSRADRGADTATRTLGSLIIGVPGGSLFPPSFILFVPFYTRILFLSLLGGQLRCRTRCRWTWWRWLKWLPCWKGWRPGWRWLAAPRWCLLPRPLVPARGPETGLAAEACREGKGHTGNIVSSVPSSAPLKPGGWRLSLRPGLLNRVRLGAPRRAGSAAAPGRVLQLPHPSSESLLGSRSPQSSGRWTRRVIPGCWPALRDLHSWQDKWGVGDKDKVGSGPGGPLPGACASAAWLARS